MQIKAILHVLYASEMQALFSAFASNNRTHRQWKCIGIGIGIFRAQKYRRYSILRY